MDQRFETGTVVGKKSDTHWAQVIKTPYAFGVVEVEDEQGKAQNVGMELIHRVTAEVSESISSIQHLFSFLDSLWKPNIQTLLLCVPMGNTVTVILRGTGVVYLKRNGAIARLRSREGTISGVVHPEDILFLSSKTCLNGVSEEEFFSFFDHLSVEDVAEKLTLHLHTKNDSVGYAGLFVEVKGDFGEPHEDYGSVAEKEERKLEQKNSNSNILKRRYTTTVHDVKNKVRPFVRTLRTVDIRITGVLLFLFFISIGIGIVKEVQGHKSTEATKTIEKGQRLYDEGMALLDLNLIKSRERFTEAKQLIDKTKQTVSSKTKEGRMIGELEKKINEALPKATKKFEVTPELFFDVSLLKSGSTIGSFGMYEDTMAFLDTNAKTVFVLQLSTKNGQIVGGGSALDGSQSVSIHGDKVYVFTPEGIHVLNVQDKSVKQLVIKKAADWIAIKSMTSFGGNVYLLDTGKSRIWKYVATGSAFTDLREFLLPDYFPDLSKATNMVIDGSVWVGTTNGSVVRFTQGKDDPFIPKGVDPTFGNNIMVFTNDSCTNVYVLDPDKRRVVVLEKDGMYKSQYTYPQTFIPKGIAASEKLGKLFLFSEGKLYTTPLQ
jgi:hypothetical protein